MKKQDRKFAKDYAGALAFAVTIIILLILGGIHYGNYRADRATTKTQAYYEGKTLAAELRVDKAEIERDEAERERDDAIKLAASFKEAAVYWEDQSKQRDVIIDALGEQNTELQLEQSELQKMYDCLDQENKQLEAKLASTRTSKQSAVQQAEQLQTANTSLNRELDLLKFEHEELLEEERARKSASFDLGTNVAVVLFASSLFSLFMILRHRKRKPKPPKRPTPTLAAKEEEVIPPEQAVHKPAKLDRKLFLAKPVPPVECEELPPLKAAPTINPLRAVTEPLGDCQQRAG